MLPKVYVMTASNFRNQAPIAMHTVRKNLSHVLITHHGKPACGLVPIRDMDVLTAVQGRSGRGSISCRWSPKRTGGR